MFILWILLLIAGYYFLKKHMDAAGEEKKTSQAEEILNMRYVNGEIDEETYLKMKQEIKS